MIGIRPESTRSLASLSRFGFSSFEIELKYESWVSSLEISNSKHLPITSLFWKTMLYKKKAKCQAKFITNLKKSRTCVYAICMHNLANSY